MITDSGTAATAAALTSRSTREQIKLLYARDGLSAEEISASLGMPLELVSSILGGGSAGEAAVPTSKDGADELLSVTRSIETAAADYREAALSKVAELMEVADSQAVQFAAAQFLLRSATGGLRPAKAPVVTTTVNNAVVFNSLVSKAAAAYEAQLRSAAQPTTSGDRINLNE